MALSTTRRSPLFKLPSIWLAYGILRLVPRLTAAMILSDWPDEGLGLLVVLGEEALMALDVVEGMEDAILQPSRSARRIHFSITFFISN